MNSDVIFRETLDQQVHHHGLIYTTTSTWWRHVQTYICRLVIYVAVVEDLLEVSYALLGTVVHILLQFFLDTPHVHRLLDNIKVILREKGDGQISLNSQMGHNCVHVAKSFHG